MAISIDFLANVSRFLRGTEDAEGALGNVGDALDGLVAQAHSSDDLADGLGQSFSTAGRKAEGALHDIKAGSKDADGSVAKLEASFKDMAQAAKRESTSAGQSISKSVKHGADDANEGVKGIKENTQANLKEVAASFDGTWSSVGSGAQGLLAEIGEGFGPLGAVVSAGLGLALGAVLSNLDAGDQHTQEFRQAVADLTQEFLDTGTVGRRSISGIADAMENLATESDPNKLNLVKLWEEAKTAGADYKGIVTGIASGNVADLGKVQAALGKVSDKHYKAQHDAAAHGTAEYGAAMKSLDAANKLGASLKEEINIAKRAAQAQELAAAAGLSDFRLKADLIDQLHSSYADAAGAVEEYTNKESGLFDVGKYIKAMSRREDALRSYQETLSKASISREARSYIESQGEDQAAALMDGYKRATPDQRETLNRIWTISGRKAAQSFSEVLGSDIADRVIRGPLVKLPAPDMSRVDAALKESRDLRVVVGYYNNTGRRII